MKLWHLYYFKEFDDSEYYYIPMDTKVNMLRSFNDGQFEIIHGISPSEGDWPDEEIHTSGKHAQSAIKIIFKYGIKK